LEKELKLLGFETVEGWPSVFLLYPNSEHTVAFVVYLDDLLMWGSKHLVEIINQLKTKIEMEDLAALQKYLGCVHQISEKLVKGETVTSVEFDMTKYFESAIEQYLELAVDKLAKVASTYAPKISSEELDELLAQEGRVAPPAARLVMKLMYGVRMAAPHLSVAIGRLASQITKWTGESDRKLHRM
jgi:hypothetical protein